MRACAECVGNARVRTVVLRALSVCVCCGVCGSFSACGVQARLSPLAEASSLRHSRPKGSTRPQHEETTYTSTPLGSLPPTFRAGRGPLRIPRLHRSAQSLQAPSLAASWIWSCECQKNSEAARQDGKYLRQMPKKKHAANLSAWRAPRNSQI